MSTNTIIICDPEMASAATTEKRDNRALAAIIAESVEIAEETSLRLDLFCGVGRQDLRTDTIQ